MARLRNTATGVVVNVDKDRLDGYEPVGAAKEPAKAPAKKATSSKK